MENEKNCKYIWMVFQSRSILLKNEADGAYSIPVGTVSPVELLSSEHIHSFEMRNGACARACKVADDVTVPPGYSFVTLRKSFEYLPYDIYEMAGKMEELIYWDSRNRYCSICGAPMQYSSPISKKCTRCAHEIWPQLQVAIIVLVKRGDEILLVQAKNFQGDYMGLVAGFVETGETLEQCVAREVMEETHVKIKNIRYFRSQAWPYPCGLMVGFVAEYVSGDIVIQRSELNKGGWFDIRHLPAIPGKVSLARQLIDARLAGEI